MQQDYFGLVEFRSIMTAVRGRIAARQMRLLDAFRAWDYNRDGRLSCSEFYGGLETHLGMTGLTQDDIHAIVRYVDKTGIGYITFEHFQQAFRKPQELVDLEGTDGADEEEEDEISAEDAAAVDYSTLIVEPKPIRELFAADEGDNATRVEEIPMNALSHIQVRIRAVKGWQPVWNSRQILSRKEVSIWSAIANSSILARNRTAICVGHFAAPGHASKSHPPSSLHAYLIELTDSDTSSLFRSKQLEVARLNFLLPHPVNFKLAWHTQRADSGVWFWRPIPPSQHFIALGMIATTSVEQPKLTEVRCVPKGQ